MVSVDDVRGSLSSVPHPEIDFSLVELGMIGDIIVEDKNVSLTLLLPFINVPIKDLLIDLIKSKLSELDSSLVVSVSVGEMSPVVKQNFFELSRKGWKL